MNVTQPEFGPEWLAIDAEQVVEDVRACLRSQVRSSHRRGVVVAISGGIDSSVVAALAVAALGPERVHGLHLPERDSAPETLGLSRAVADRLGIASTLEDITPVLDAAGCYRRRDDAVRSVYPAFRAGDRWKIVLPDVLADERYRLYSVVVESADGRQTRHRLSHDAYLQIVAATNFKQRVRAMMAYYHADRLNYVVGGTPNRLEYDQGFFVKLGDGAADVKPIAHLYKSQVYALAEYLGVPEEIRRRPPTTDTYSLSQSQEEFYFSVPYDVMDLCLLGRNLQVAPAEVARATGLTGPQVDRVFRDIDQKRRATGYLHQAARLVHPVPEIAAASAG